MIMLFRDNQADDYIKKIIFRQMIFFLSIMYTTNKHTTLTLHKVYMFQHNVVWLMEL